MMRIWVIKRKTLLILAVIAAIIILLTAFLVVRCQSANAASTVSAAAIEEYELNVLAGKKRELPVYAVARSDQAVALTIDAAWEDDKTDFILETLQKHDVKATFFLCGVWVEAYPDQVKAIAAAGHEIGNHSLSHPHMNRLDAIGVQKEISDLDDKIEALTGKRCTLFRAPYGEYNDTVIRAVRDIGYEPIQWNLDTIDWKPERSADTILNAVLPGLTGGSIILCHNNGYQIENYLPALIEQTQEKGFSFVTVSELLLTGSTTIDANGVQQPAKETPAPTPAPTPKATPAAA